MKDILYMTAGVAVFASLMFGFLVFSLREAYARVRYEKAKRELKKQGQYEEWASANRRLLAAKAIAVAGSWSGLPGSLFFNWLGYRQMSMVFLGIFVICLVASMSINRILYKKIHQDPK